MRKMYKHARDIMVPVALDNQTTQIVKEKPVTSYA
jgi:hypothetical protein